ncbi:MAG: hypothetical protein DRP87_09805 [Spirochaetes bacterium]|nr:MAG: hypothetical protein DRP87_09805 [Spirochaetota bacterium]
MAIIDRVAGNSARGIEIVKHTILYQDNDYNCFPSIVRADNGSLLMVFRKAEDPVTKFGKPTHIDPGSKIVLIRSIDNGKTWSDEPRLVFDDDCGENDPCITRLSDGSVLLTFYKWRVVPVKEERTLGTEKDREYFAVRIDRERLALLEGAYCMRSKDNGESWDGPWEISNPYYVYGKGIRGNAVELGDGTILLPMYGVKEYGEFSRAFLMRSVDRGVTWQFFADIASHRRKHFLEPFLYRMESGGLVAFLRTQTDFGKKPFYRTYRNLHVCYSEDGGRRWSKAQKTNVFCPNPVHALRLAHGKVLLTYGYRKKPFGIRARLLDGECNNISKSKELILRQDGEKPDLGYTSAVALSNREVLVVYYFNSADGYGYIAGTILDLQR